MKKILMYIITTLAVIFIINNKLNIISYIMRILSLIWIYILAKKYNVWG